jgi:hypothetical protein
MNPPIQLRTINYSVKSNALTKKALENIKLYASKSCSCIQSSHKREIVINDAYIIDECLVNECVWGSNTKGTGS